MASKRRTPTVATEADPVSPAGSASVPAAPTRAERPLEAPSAGTAPEPATMFEGRPEAPLVLLDPASAHDRDRALSMARSAHAVVELYAAYEEAEALSTEVLAAYPGADRVVVDGHPDAPEGQEAILVTVFAGQTNLGSMVPILPLRRLGNVDFNPRLALSEQGLTWLMEAMSDGLTGALGSRRSSGHDVASPARFRQHLAARDLRLTEEQTQDALTYLSASGETFDRSPAWRQTARDVDSLVSDRFEEAALFALNAHSRRGRA